MWKRKRKLAVEAPEATIFYGSGKHEMNGSGNGSGSSKKILEADGEAIKITKPQSASRVDMVSRILYVLIRVSRTL